MARRHGLHCQMFLVGVALQSLHRRMGNSADIIPWECRDTDRTDSPHHQFDDCLWKAECWEGLWADAQGFWRGIRQGAGRREWGLEVMLKRGKGIGSELAIVLIAGSCAIHHAIVEGPADP